jgi:two-component system sensor histidine kinase ChvG
VAVWTEGGTDEAPRAAERGRRRPGIPAKERDKVFERFHSVRPAGEAFGAHSGLGLAIARTIAEAHDGRLTILDRPDGARGACLVLTLPHAGEVVA